MTNTRKRLLALVVAFAMVFSALAIMSVEPTYAATKTPAKVTGVKWAKAGADKVKLTWKKAANAKKYEIYYGYKDADGKMVWACDGVSKKTTYTTTQGQFYTYYYKVRAINGTKAGKFSASTKAIKLKITNYKGYKVPNYGTMFGYKVGGTDTEDGFPYCVYYEENEDVIDARAEDYKNYLESLGFVYDEENSVYVLTDDNGNRTIAAIYTEYSDYDAIGFTIVMMGAA